ncbi:hypothetical protein CHS0354_021262 [Potamilus streckersoni]|uniref:Peptidase M12B domain-containing protein n=1 Tax=Potamilus streckersoni TaxID=2493646 RepID=A0AAE0S425_9BIVA|nr:hypothetical protein CHS0354_021262 [Potamilus streckersoni]
MSSMVNVIPWAFITLLSGHISTSLGLEYADGSHEIEEFILSRKLREYGLKDFELSQLKLLENGNIIDSNILRRMKRSTSFQQPITLSVPAYGETFQLELMHVRSVLHPSATISTRAGDAEENKWTGTHPDCFLAGSVTSHSGTASISYCSELRGYFNDDVHEYHIQSLPEQIIAKFTQLNNSSNILVARGLKTPSLENQDYIDSVNSGSEWTEDTWSHERSRRATSIKSIEVETAVYTDQLMTEILENGGATSMETKIERMLVQWNGVQSEWSKRSQLGYDVKITIKRMIFFTQDPSWYNASTQLGATVHFFCQGTKNETAFDHMHMHTGQRNTDVSGMAYQNGACKSSTRCAVSAEKLIPNFYIPAHELGHTLGLRHDGDSGCFPPNDGTMGKRTTDWSNCSITQLNSFLQSDRARCLFETNIMVTEIPVKMRSIVLKPMMPGMLYTEDEICELTKGKGWRHRSLPWWTSCNWRSCINMNIGSLTYGQMENYGTGISGQYCGEGKVCHVGNCMTWAETGLDSSLFIVVPGGWGTWQMWTTCSRTCGRSVRFRRRICDNPKPRNSPPCEGEEYQATFCNMQPCVNDSSDTSDLIRQRAGEVCTGLIASGAFSSDLYDGTGNRFHYMEYATCEVTCTPKNNYTPSTQQRYGLMPDGTPCRTKSLEPTYGENIGAPGSTGKVTACLQGYCKVFGCDGTLSNKVRDRCGVCGGDNSTCYVNEGVFLVNTTMGERVVVATLPKGTYNIFFHFKWEDMKQNYLELWSDDERAKPIIASLIAGFSSIYENRNNPREFAGTKWTYFFAEQYLFAEGPTNETVKIKLYQKSKFPNTGVNYGYSIPRPQHRTTAATRTELTRSSKPVTESQYTSIAYSVPTATSPTTTCKVSCRDDKCRKRCGQDDAVISSAEFCYHPLLAMMLCVLIVMTMQM